MTTYKELNRRNNELDKRLNATNKAIMTDMVVYLRGSRLSDFQVEVIRQDLLDMALSAQERQVPLSEVFGEDYQRFCDEVIASAWRQDWLWSALDWIRYISLGLAILALIDCLLSRHILDVWHLLASGARQNPLYPISLGFVFSTVVILVAAHAIVYLICRFSFQTARLLALSKVKRFALGAGIAAVACLYLWAVYTWSGVILVRIPLLTYLAAVTFLLLVYGGLSVIVERRSVPVTGLG
ncbi:MAG: hypothetical protein K6T63_11915 [Alicyclobacillus herbarius]|uniref:hypothetical protein n=1 Tax=Alicyclobacillus herbarius TaxID=122960 RepID=UPI002352F62E|nr:hypothetical protein [Alicyclobacillus herbarius]MCL6633323.1 hypothetical protein [Alicyclobacillus herbarius]